MTSTTSKEIVEEYTSSLAELTFNSKPLINMLTMLADDNVEHAAAIVKAVENHLQKVRSDIKLPVLYLIDSIVKNVNGAYLKLFSENIVTTFSSVFEKVDEKTRESMWKLRQTWNDVFPATKLFTLDLHVQSIDPAWPVAPLSPAISSGSIHLNPRFLSRTQQNAPTPPVVAPVKVEPVSVTAAAMREQLLKKQKRLLELQKQKIELELLQTTTNLEEQQKQLDKQAATVKATPVTIPTAHVMPTTEAAQGKPVAPVVPSQASKSITKIPSSLLKNVGANNGPKIAPASSLLVASAKSLSRDPRIKSSSSQEQVGDVDSRQQTMGLSLDTDASTTAISPVLVDSLKQQLLPHRQAVIGTVNNKTTLNHTSEVVASLNASSNDNPIASLNNNNNNKSLSGNLSRDAVVQRASQKKDPRSSNSNNSCGNLNSNSTKTNSSQSNSGGVSLSSFSTTNSTRKDVKSNKDSKSSTSNRSSSSSSLDNKSLKSPNRKVGSKSRSKQPHHQVSPNKIAKLDRDSSPIRSKSREKDSSDGSSSTSSRTSPQSSSQSKNRKKSSGKSRKRSPSPPYKIPRRSSENKSSSASLSMSANSGGLTEEMQSGSLIVSPPPPPTFKEIRQKQRNYVRRNKDTGTLSPDHSSQSAGAMTDDGLLESASKDEDLRAVLVPPSAPCITAGAEKKEDLDLRLLPPSTKRQGLIEPLCPPSKKSKSDKFDALFGNEDVDLRTLTHPKAGRPPTPPPPVISGDDNRANWAKIKTPTKNEREKSLSGDEKRDDKRDRDRNKDRPPRARLFNKISDDIKDRRRPFGSDDDSRSGRRSRDLDKSDRISSDRNIEIIMKQAQEQLNQGAISKAEYHKLIQEIWQMNEDQKLRAAQRKEKEVGSIVWEKGIEIGGYSPGDAADMGHRGKDHPHRNAPRWQGQWQHPGPGPWSHPPGFSGHFNNDFRPLGPWQNPRQFGPIRSDFNQFHGFNPVMGPGPRMGPGLMGPMGPNGPMMPGIMSNGPMGPIGMPNAAMSALNGPQSLMMNGPHQHGLLGRVPSPARNISPNSAPKFDVDDSRFCTGDMHEAGGRELPQPDSKLVDEISKDTMKSINIDGVPREIRYYGQTGIVFMKWDDPREIGFQNGVRRIFIDDKDSIVCGFNEPYQEFMYDGEVHRIRLGAPSRELYVDDKWFECYFSGPPIKVDLGNKKVAIKLDGPPPQVKIGTVKRTDLVIAKINLIINARNMVPVFLDAKPQTFEIDGQLQTLEFIDSLETVLLNGRPFKVEFGGLPKPITIGGKKHFIRFSVLPRGVRAGYVKIAGMKGEAPVENSADPVGDMTLKMDPMTAPPTVPGLELDSISQDASDVSMVSKPDSQLDILSSVLSSMAPSSGMSYQAEPTDKPASPAAILPPQLNLNELFQRLVETGMVPKTVGAAPEPKKLDEECKKEPELIVTFEKPEASIRVRNYDLASRLFSGMQCSSCGERFAADSATKYSYHLDWHFRQNRRERDPARKAPNRSLFYTLNDWIQFEEMEDLEDRAQSWFEIEKQSAEADGANVDDVPQESVQPSVPTGLDADAVCQVCRDAFEQFYNEEKEEWHLRPAVIYEEKNYHPLCLQDHKRSLEKSEHDESVDEEKKEDLDESDQKITEETNEEVESTMETTEEVNADASAEETPSTDAVEENLEGAIADIQLNAEEILEENTNEKTLEDQDNLGTETEAVEQSEIVNTDDVKPEDEVTTENTAVETTETIDTQSIVVKTEPEDSAEMEWSPPDGVEIKTEPPEPEPEEETVSETVASVDTTLAAVKSSIDGNVEHESAPVAIPTAPSRIKINITKPIVSKEPEEPKEKPPAVETPADENTGPQFPASIKSTLQGRKLSNLPPIEKGHELSGLCSIM